MGQLSIDPHTEIRTAYNAVKESCRNDWSSEAAKQALHDLVVLSLQFLVNECSPVGLQSAVSNKEYVSYVRKGISNVLSRPANSDLFLPDPNVISALWKAWTPKQEACPNLRAMLYTMALAPCLVMELFDRQNKKGPATYFEHFIGHIFARTLGVNPRKRTSLPIRGRSVSMTMDFLFDLSADTKVHLPVKMSTRERVVQAWAHQRMLNSAYGDNVYKGIMVIFCETKLDFRSREVIEICVPDQWLAYQMLLARMERIYYFDLPARYATLAKAFPTVMPIKCFTDLFIEKEIFDARL